MGRAGVDVVVPVAASAAGLRVVVERLREGLTLGPGDRLVVVDNRGVGVHDAPEVVVAAEVRTSYAARNAGAAVGSAPWLLFLDADVVPPRDLLDRLLSPEPGPRVGVVAGGISDGPGDGLARRYARLRGSMSAETVLDGRGRWAFAQTAHALVRRSAFEAVGGFEAGVRSAGDADLCFRLAEAGWELGSRLEVRVVHENRATVRGLLGQRFRHGTGSAWLEGRWPGAAPPRRLAGVAWWGVRRLVAGLAGAVRRRDRDEAVLALLDGPAVVAFELGRRAANRPLPHARQLRAWRVGAHQGRH